MAEPKLSYGEMRALSNDKLGPLLDSPSRMVGSIAAEILQHRRAFDLIYEAVRAGTLKTALGRKRALFVLLQAGPAYTNSLKAFLYLLSDRSKLVVEEALFGLCHWNNPDTLPELDRVTCRGMEELTAKARKAIQARDIRLFSPYYSISEMWDDHQGSCD